LLAYASNRHSVANLDVYVQQVAGGPSIRLTDDPADDHQPNLSPDGSLVAFRSERVPAGIYVAPALGGSARLIAPGGRLPRFSPDGRFIAFEIGAWLAPVGLGNERQVFVVPTIGGAPTRVASNLANAGGAIWAPDGQSLLVLGRRSHAGSEAETAMDWWRVSTQAGAHATPTGAFAEFARRGIDVELNTERIPYPGAWVGEWILFSATTDPGGSLDIWRLSVEPRSARPSGDLQRLTRGTTHNWGVTISGDGHVAWAASTSSRTQFGLPIEANSGKTTGPLARLHDQTAPSGRSAITEDGRLLVFPREDYSTGGLWVLDLQNRHERQLVATPRTPLNPVVSPDGQWVGYTVTMVQTGGDSGIGDGYAVRLLGGTPRKVCSRCDVAGWTRGGQIVFRTLGTVVRADPENGTTTPLAAVTDGQFYHPYFGPDDEWVLFNSRGRIIRAPVHPNRATPESEWTTLVQTQGNERSAGLSPDARLLYLLMEVDGFRCLYGLSLDGQGQAVGRPFLVAHLHDATLRWGSTSNGNAVGKGLFVADLYESRGNIWTSQLAVPAPQKTVSP
jgi:Tol biopolymer transport system component